ncbi:menaquinone-specific isochorismate synthase [Bacillus methanolicus MGA3]|uniref:isochorismate synthase n=1 Tax=Bacillus methanolicus (strain MGA3 / ATCC 53907) TaxID=796606 RepID=I3EC74_BACMM|nr:menaquinone-specific isochorismate synthase [Bacillus methanolicus MGA3]EIJ84095.1 menaquinone-specific isochorismate synthase [Bacillus methanolicus MGA3]
MDNSHVKAVIGGIFLVTIQDTELKERIEKAILKTRELGRPILVSEVQKISHIKPLSLFAAGRDKFFGERFFWKDPAGQMILVGLGICKQIQSDQASDRFFHVETEWKRFIDDSDIHNEYSQSGIGPIMFGGFSFDPLKEKTDLWAKFSDSLFYIPVYMLSIINGQAFFTTNILCTQHDHPSIIEKIIKERDEIIESIYIDYDYGLPEIQHEKESNPNEWKETVAKVVEDLKGGKLKKVVLARDLRITFNQEVKVETVLSRLLTEQKESFVYAFESNGDCFISASPERLLKKNGKDVYSACVAGSIGRGKTVEEDELLGDTLLNDQKNLIEHQYVVEMIREAMKEICDEVFLPDKPKLLKIRDIQHLYTPVVGKNKNNQSLLRFVEKLHPTPALGGFPKVEAMAKIREAEKLDRGFYAAPLGWIDYKGNGEFAVSIRSGLIQGKEASLFAGCGVVADSDAESEYRETAIKFRPMLSALGGRI